MENKIKKYTIRILMQSGTYGTLKEEVTAIELHSAERGYYCFKTQDGKLKYYPISNTIIEEIGDVE
jgi:hypothetical protein